MTGQNDRARLQTLTDAIIAAVQAVGTIPPQEAVRDVTFGQDETGGWTWEIETARYATYGNTKKALTFKPQQNSEANTRAVVESAMISQTAQSGTLR